MIIPRPTTKPDLVMNGAPFEQYAFIPALVNQGGAGGARLVYDAQRPVMTHLAVVQQAYAARIHNPHSYPFRPDGSIAISDIRVMQAGLRATDDEMEALKRRIKAHGLPQPVLLQRMSEDGRVYLHDGRHRLRALTDLGFESLSRDMYKMEEFSYDDMLQIVLTANDDGTLDVGHSWLTPFDPRESLRQSDIWPFKQFIKMLFDQGAHPVKLAHFIRTHPELYLEAA